MQVAESNFRHEMFSMWCKKTKTIPVKIHQHFQTKQKHVSIQNSICDPDKSLMSNIRCSGTNFVLPRRCSPTKTLAMESHQRIPNSSKDKHTQPRTLDYDKSPKRTACCNCLMSAHAKNVSTSKCPPWKSHRRPRTNVHACIAVTQGALALKAPFPSAM